MLIICELVIILSSKQSVGFSTPIHWRLDLWPNTTISLTQLIFCLLLSPSSGQEEMASSCTRGGLG